MLFWFVNVTNPLSLYVFIAVDIVGAFGSLSVSIESDSLVLSVGMPGDSLYFLFCRSRRLVVYIACPNDKFDGWLGHSFTRVLTRG